jgi:hypothetical protein
MFFKNQLGLTEEQHIALAERFGTSEIFPFSVREDHGR